MVVSKGGKAGLRDAIIETSLELGSQLGEEGLTMRGIAARLGVSATALYQHFESKASILQEIRVYGTDLLYKALEPKLTIEDHNERLIAMNMAYIDFARRNPWLYTVLMEHDQLDWDELGEEDVKRTLRALEAVRESMRRGAEAGAWREGVDLELASFQMWAAVHGLCSLMIAGRIDEKHPAFPVSSEKSLIESFVQNLVRTCMM
jgi:AcrR family transcriptional regulator